MEHPTGRWWSIPVLTTSGGEKKLNRRLVSSREAVEQKLKTIAGHYFCLADAQEAARRASECSTSLFQVETTITESAVFGRGRPPAHGPRPTVSRFVLSCRINEDRAAVEREQTLAVSSWWGSKRSKSRGNGTSSDPLVPSRGNT